MSEDVIEKMARAICRATHGPYPVDADHLVAHHGGLFLPYWRNFEAEARACYPIAFNAGLERAAALTSNPGLNPYDNFVVRDIKTAILAERVKETP